MEKLKVTERAWNWIIWGIWWLLPHVNIQMCLVFEKLALQIVSVCWNVIGWFTSHELHYIHRVCLWPVSFPCSMPFYSSFSSFLSFYCYSWTSLYQTRIIRTSAYIEVALWSRPPAIVTGGKIYRIYQTRVCQILGYIEHAAPPRTCPRRRL